MRQSKRKECQISDDTVVIGHSGRFSVEKNHRFLLEIFSFYHELNPNSKLMLLGDGPERKNIEKMILKKNLEQDVILLGRQKNPENYLCAMDCFVFPSFYEGISLALIEAQCNGLRCFVSDKVDIRSKQIEEFHIFSIASSAQEIASCLFSKNVERDRVESYFKILESNFDLKKETEKLEEYYINLNLQ